MSIQSISSPWELTYGKTERTSKNLDPKFRGAQEDKFELSSEELQEAKSKASGVSTLVPFVPTLYYMSKKPKDENQKQIKKEKIKASLLTSVFALPAFLTMAPILRKGKASTLGIPHGILAKTSVGLLTIVLASFPWIYYKFLSKSKENKKT